jgi:hypothetical protein
MFLIVGVETNLLGRRLVQNHVFPNSSIDAMQSRYWQRRDNVEVV